MDQRTKELADLGRRLDAAAARLAPHVQRAADSLWDTPLATPRPKRSPLQRLWGVLVRVLQLFTLQTPNRAEQFRQWAEKRRASRQPRGGGNY